MIAVLVALAAACPDLDAELDRIAAALPRGPEEAAARAAAAESLGCLAPSRGSLGRYWLVEAGLLARDGDPLRADLAGEAARRLLPPDDPRLTGLAPSPPPGSGWLVVDTNRLAARIDTLAPEVWPAEVPAGVHLIQVLPPEGTGVWYGKVVRVVAGEEVLVETGLPEASPAETPPEATTDVALPTLSEPVAPERRRRSAWWFVASGVAAGGAAGLYYLADHERPAIAAADDLAGLDGAFTRQRLYAGGAVLLSAGTGFGVVGYFLF